MAEGNDVYVHKFSLTAGGKWLIKDSGLVLVQGRRYGLVGPNGCGKSTLMHAIANREDEIGKGTPSHLDILLVEQEVAASDTSALEMVISADTKRLALMEEVAKLEALLDAKDGDAGEVSERLRVAYDGLEAIGAASAEQRASAILSGLQFTEEQKGWPTRSFSGGWRMRISLARALFRQPRLLLLDEPTNHLDLHAVIWLEGYLSRWKNILVVVSHDRSFLATVTTDILHIWQARLVHYAGNFDVFEKVFVSKLDEYRRDYEKQQKRLKALKRAGKITTDLSKSERTESKAKKKDREKLLAGSAKASDLVQAGEDGGELLQPLKDHKITIQFNAGGECAHPLISVSSVTFGYSAERVLFSDVSFGVAVDSRVALVGANGTGKSTLLKLITEEIAPSSGSVQTARSVRVGVYSQHSAEQLVAELTPVTYLQQRFPELNYQQIRNTLGKFGLEGHHHEQVIHTLSGGQKARVVFVELGLQKTHVLLLDEPTNHLDLETVDALIDGLKNYAGGVFVITHNVQLINQVCDEIWILDNNRVNVWKGEFDEYREFLEEQLAVYQLEQESSAAVPKASRKAAAAGGSDGQFEVSGAAKSKEERKREREAAKEHARLKAEAQAREVEERARAELARQEAAAAQARAEAEAAAREARERRAAASAQRRAEARRAAQLAEGVRVDIAASVALLVAALRTPARADAPREAADGSGGGGGAEGGAGAEAGAGAGAGAEAEAALVRVLAGCAQLVDCATHLAPAGAAEGAAEAGSAEAQEALEAAEGEAASAVLGAYLAALLGGGGNGGSGNGSGCVALLRAHALPLGLLRYRAEQAGARVAADAAVLDALDSLCMRSCEAFGKARKLKAAADGAAAGGGGSGGAGAGSATSAALAAAGAACASLAPLLQGLLLLELVSEQAAMDWLAALDSRASHDESASASIARKLDAQRCALARDCLLPTATWLRTAVAQAEAEAEAEEDENDAE